MIKTERLILKPLTSDDEKAVSELFTDDTVKKTYLLPDFKDAEHLHNYFNRILALSNGNDRYLLGIYINNGTELVGIINDTGLEKYESAEIGYALLPRYFNNGYATEAFGGMIKFLKDVGYKKVVAGAFEENKASIRVMEKCGLVPKNESEKLEYRGKEHTVIYYFI